MAKVTPEEFAKEWAEGLKAKTTKIRRGVERVREAPGVKAAAKQDKLVANWQESINSGKWANNVSAIGVDEWRDKTIRKGLQRIPAGVDEATTRMQEFGAQLLDHIDRGKPSLDRIDDSTVQGRKDRMNMWFDHMKSFRPKR